jgi:hypothetical protein
VSGCHLEFLRHFEVLFLKIHIFSFYGLDYQNMSSDHEMIIALHRALYLFVSRKALSLSHNHKSYLITGKKTTILYFREIIFRDLTFCNYLKKK